MLCRRQRWLRWLCLTTPQDMPCCVEGSAGCVGYVMHWLCVVSHSHCHTEHIKTKGCAGHLLSGHKHNKGDADEREFKTASLLGQAYPRLHWIALRGLCLPSVNSLLFTCTAMEIVGHNFYNSNCD